MTTTYDGVELESTLAQISGSIELDDDQAGLVSLGDTVKFVGRGRVKTKSSQTGGQNTKPRLIVTIAFDALDDLKTTDAFDQVPGQTKIGDDPATPSDDD